MYVKLFGKTVKSRENLFNFEDLRIKIPVLFSQLIVAISGLEKVFYVILGMHKGVMMKFINEEIEGYAISKSNRPSQYVKELGDETRANVPMSMMLVGEMEGSLLGFLVRSLKVKRVLEIGTYTGYSALCMAENLPEEGEVITLDIDDELTPLSKKYWGQSPDGKKINKVIGPALETIPKLDGEFDLVFIDADKQNYLNYLKLVIPRLSEKGIVVVDNVLWSGKVLKAPEELDPTDTSTAHIQELNDYVSSSSELYGTLLPIRDGIFLITKV